MAVPSMLVAYGVALRLGPGLGRAGSVSELATTSTLKLLVQPVAAWFVASVVLGVEGHALLAIVVTSALPTAQNIFVHATRYDRATILARDTILITTIGSVPVILLLAWRLG
jgi:predicted permease